MEILGQSRPSVWLVRIQPWPLFFFERGQKNLNFGIFSRARPVWAWPNPIRASPNLIRAPARPKNPKKSRAEKTSFLSILLRQKIEIFVAGAPEHFCWILGRLGLDSFLKGSTLFFTSENKKMRFSMVVHVAERHFPRGKPRKI